MTDPLARLIEEWRAKAAQADTVHATMGIGWKSCADELSAILSGSEQADAVTELSLIREAANDQSLSDGVVRAVALGTRPPTTEDIAWAQSVLASGSPAPETLQGCYCASRASVPERPAMWRRLRDQEGWQIVSSWIDEAGPGETADMGELWTRIRAEIQSAVGVVLYVEPDDFPLKGALVECGIAIGLGKPVVIVLGGGLRLEPGSLRPVGSWAQHPSVTFATLDEARDQLRYMAANGHVYGLAHPLPSETPPLEISELNNRWNRRALDLKNNIQPSASETQEVEKQKALVERWSTKASELLQSSDRYVVGRADGLLEAADHLSLALGLERDEVLDPPAEALLAAPARQQLKEEKDLAHVDVGAQPDRPSASTGSTASDNESAPTYEELAARASKLEDAAFHFQTCQVCKLGDDECESGRWFAAFLCGEVDGD